jgi:hypothetical protein
VSSKGVFSAENKHTVFFAPGLILPLSATVHSVCVCVNAKSSGKSRKFEFFATPEGTPDSTALANFETDDAASTVFHEFDPPLKIVAKAKMSLMCDIKIESLAVLTIKYDN